MSHVGRDASRAGHAAIRAHVASVTDNVNDDQILIARYCESFGRMGCIVETFACTRLEFDALLAWGEYNHGEVLGKHSDITGTFDEKTLKVLVAADSEEDANFIARAIELRIVHDCPYSECIADYIASYGDDASPYLTRLAKLGAERLAKLAALWGFGPAPADEEPDDASGDVE